MKPRIILLLASVLALTAAPGLHAAGADKPARLALTDERRLLELVGIYSLTVEQCRQLQLLFEERAAMIEAVRTNVVLDDKERGRQSRAIYNRIDREFTTILTPKQQNLKKQLAAERAAKKKASK